MNRKIKIIIVIVAVLLLAYAAYYVTDYHHAEKAATDLMNGSDNVSVSKVSNGLFLDGKGNDTALIFYPGAKYEYISYLPLLMQLAEDGIDCYLVEMPLNFAILDIGSADSIIDTTNYSHYIMSGHSLGGLAASTYANQSNRSDGVVLLASYPTEKLDIPVLSIYGSNDNVLNMKNYDESKALMSNLTEVVIEGANHAQFANCGIQDGDGVAAISADSQQTQCANEIIRFINTL